MRNRGIITGWEDVPLIFDIPWATKLLGRSYDNIKKLCQQGRLPAFKTGREWRFEKGAFQRWMEAQYPYPYTGA